MFGSVALTRIVPVVWSIWLSISATVPVSSSALPSRDSAVAVTGPRASAALSCANCSSGRLKMTEMGSSCVTTTMPAVSTRVDVVARVDLADAGAPVDRRA